MKTFFTERDEAFRQEVRTFLRTNLSAELAEATRRSIHLLPREVTQAWQALLHAKEWSAPHWPKEYGGAGWTPGQRFIFESEIAAADAPFLSVFGTYLVGPTLYTFGTPAQKKRYLPGIQSGKDQWCQGYSEPNAGSDLASLRTTAQKVDGGWRITGQKAWTTEAHCSDLMICLARSNTGVKPQAGLSLFIVDMRAPSVSSTPVITIDEGHSVNAVFLDDVLVGDDALIGEEGKGWTYAKFLLNHERTNNAQVYRSRREFDRLVQLAARTRDSAGKSLLDDEVIADRFAEASVELSALEISVLRTLSSEIEGGVPGGQAATLKIEGSVLQQRISSLSMAVLGERAIVASSDRNDPTSQEEAAGWIERHLFRRAVTIYGGSNEIQKNIIAKSVIGL